MLLLLVLGVVAFFIYFNRVGLPDFVKGPLISELKSRGVVLEFERIRYRWYRGIVAENVRVGRSDVEGSPRVSADEVVVRLADDALWHNKYEVTGLLIQNGRVELPLIESNRPPALVTVEGISTDLRFLPGDLWELNDFKATFQGIHLRMAGTLTNASLLSRKKPKEKDDPARIGARKVWQHQVRQVKQVLDQLKFATEPDIYLVLNADAKSPERLSGAVQLSARGVQSPWGDASNITLSAPLNAITNLDGTLRSELRLRLDQARTPWAGARQARLELRVDSDSASTMPSHVEADLKLVTADVRWGKMQSPSIDLKIRSDRVSVTGAFYQTTVDLSSPGLQTAWGSSKRLELQASGRHSVTGAPPEKLSLRLNARGVREPHATVEELDLTLESTLLSSIFRMPTNEWKGWQQMAPYALAWKLKARQLEVTNLSASALSVRGRWTAPDLMLEEFSMTAPVGTVDGSGSFNVTNRNTALNATATIEWHQLTNWFGPGLRKVVEDLRWDRPPKLALDLNLPLPRPGTVTATNWMEALAPLKGAVKVDSGPVNYRGVEVKGIQINATLTNLIAEVPILKITR
ncbi:MAG TPA: hypothetical protein VK968_09415, partial [Roseimicrobium sp.]|nr:hypothetical protein [Roseimicrobium sp.]